jgi:hypothetical protein
VTLLIGGRLDRSLPHDDGSCLKERSRDEGWRNSYAVLRADFKVHLVIQFQVDAQIQYNNGSPGTRRPEIKYVQLTVHRGTQSTRAVRYLSASWT